MARERPYYRWFPKDFAADSRVLAMDNTQELIYRRLLDRSWELGCLPSDEGALARLSGVRVDTFRRAWAYPLTECWEANGDGKLLNQRLEDERDAVATRSVKSRNAVAKRWRDHELRLRKSLKSKHRVDTSVLPNHTDVLPGDTIPDPDPDPDPDPEKKQDLLPGVREKIDRNLSIDNYKKRAKARSRSSTAAIIRWNPEKEDFEGEVDKLLARLRGKHLEEFGKDWLNHTWANMEDWCRDKPEELGAMESHWLFVLNWFRREAADRRKELES